VSDVSDPVDEDYIGLYVGQSHIVRMRIARHLWDRYTKDSFHYRTTRRVDKSVRYVTLGLINIECLEETPKTVLHNIGELSLCLFFQTLAPIVLKQYLPEETIRHNSIGLNRKDLLHQGLRASLNQGPDAAWATCIDQTVRALHTQHMKSIH